MQETNEAGSRRFAQPGAEIKSPGATEWLESGIPMLGPMLAKAGHQFESGDVGGGFGTTAGAAFANDCTIGDGGRRSDPWQGWCARKKSRPSSSAGLSVSARNSLSGR